MTSAPRPEPKTRPEPHVNPEPLVRPEPNALGEYLKARRRLRTPAEAGLAGGDTGSRRRTPGLRREELAVLAGISVEYYVRLERGRDRHPSPQVLDALARALGLDHAAASHLAALAIAPPSSAAAQGPRTDVSPVLQRMLDDWSERPAFVLSRHLDVLAANPIGALLHAPLAAETNVLRQVFTVPAARSFYVDWDDVAQEAVGNLRGLAAAELNDPRLVSLVGDLCLNSPDFAGFWAAHDIRTKSGGDKRIHHPEVGELAIHWESLTMPSSPGQMVVVYDVEPGSASADALTLLARLRDTRSSEAANQ